MTMLSPGLLQGFFQFGYVTPDLDAAMAVYRERFNVPEFMLLDGKALDPTAKSTLRVALAWIGDTMVELIEPIGENALYGEALPAAGVRLHHLGYRVADEARWSATLDELALQEVPLVRLRTPSPHILECFYADTRPLLGHYVEFVWTKAGQPDFFAQVPRAPAA